MSLGWVYDRCFLDHDTGNVHVDQPRRLKALWQAVEDTAFFRQLQPLKFRLASADQLALVHEPAYVDLVRMMSDGGFTYIGSPDTVLCSKSYDVAASASGAVLAACDAVAAGEIWRAFCAVRPPGHHAEADQAMGFCLFNHVAIAAEHLVRHQGMTRVAIVDFDAHHGNGTQHLFEHRRDVLYISIHESGGYPGTGQPDEQGTGDGTGFTVNIPLARGSGLEQYMEALQRTVLPTLDRFAPQLLLLSAGFDSLAWDTTSNLALDPQSYEPITRALVEAVDGSADGRVISVLEGGYDLANLGQAVVSHLHGLLPRAGARGASPLPG